MLKLIEEKKKLDYMIEQNKSYQDILKQSQIVDKYITNWYISKKNKTNIKM